DVEHLHSGPQAGAPQYFAGFVSENGGLLFETCEFLFGVAQNVGGWGPVLRLHRFIHARITSHTRSGSIARVSAASWLNAACPEPVKYILLMVSARLLQAFIREYVGLLNIDKGFCAYDRSNIGPLRVP